MDTNGTVAAQLAAPDTILTMWRKIAAYHEIPLTDFGRSDVRYPKVTRVRREAFAMICAFHSGKSISNIARILGFDHSTVLYALARSAGMRRDEKAIGRWRNRYMDQRAAWRWEYRHLCAELEERGRAEREAREAEEKRAREIEEERRRVLTEEARLQAIYRRPDRVATQIVRRSA